MKILRIAIIDPVGQKAGLDHYDLSLAKALNNQSASVKVYSNFSFSENNSIVNNQFTFTFRNDFLQLLRIFRQYISALRKARKEKTEIIILHLFHSSFIDLLFIRLAVYFRLTVCIIMHDIESLIEKQSKSRIEKCVNLASYVIVHNSISYDELITRIKSSDIKKINVIPHGNYLGMQAKIDRDKVAAYFNLDINKKYLLFFGIIKKSKGLEILIDAMEKISQDVELIIAGKTRDINFETYREQISKLNLSERVHTVVRYITNTERNMLFNFSDIAILPYQKIYQSGIMLLAMSYGLPVIASDLPANKLIIGDKNGLLFKVGNSSDLASKINQLIFDDQKRSNISNSAKEYIRVNNDWNKISEEFINIFK